jgi:hypothetical protein
MFENIVVWIVIILAGLYLFKTFHRKWKTLNDPLAPECGGTCSGCAQTCEDKDL